MHYDVIKWVCTWPRSKRKGYTLVEGDNGEVWILKSCTGTSSTQVSLQVWMIEIVQTIPDIYRLVFVRFDSLKDRRVQPFISSLHQT